MKILFVCLGNICRSAAAEAIMKWQLNQHGVSDYQIDSAGTAGYHQGELADARMRAKRNMTLPVFRDKLCQKMPNVLTGSW